MSGFILALIQEFNNLKKSTLYFVLVGKKTSSVLVYGYFNDLLPYFGLAKNLTREQYEQMIRHLVSEKKIIIENGYLKRQNKNPISLKTTYPALKGYPYSIDDEGNWHLFLFGLQVFSELSFANRDYQVLSDQFLSGQKIKFWLKVVGKEQWPKAQTELQQIMEKLPEETSQRLSLFWHGHQVNGQINAQIYAAQFSGKLQYKNDLHAFFTILKVGPYPIWQQLLVYPATSVEQTGTLVANGASFSEILSQRPALKPSTLRDHLLELAIFNPAEFPFPHFYENKTLLQVEKLALENLRDWRFKEIFPENTADFLTYRLYQIQQIAIEKTKKVGEAPKINE
ncbi:RQC domain-containing protein [Enterococcus timonensis]|uniref:RQC domain-containing protein n=1 Tax=Enterococcus timonensis TaxID=1852364 RepID=UPI0008DA2FC8|nr:RQC domain-containing protein [Enterococcus timonensis]